MRRSVFEPGPGKWDPNDVQKLNVRRVFTSIAANPGNTAADACRETGLSPATMSRLLEQLVERDLVIEGEPVRRERGQPGVALRMNSAGAYSVGCALGYGSGFAILRSLGGQILSELEFQLESCELSHVVQSVSQAYRHLMLNQPADVAGKLVGVGIACPADFPRLFETGSGMTADGAGWNEESFRHALADAINVPVSTYATGSAGAWAELAFTPKPRPANFMYVFIDRFVQSGFLLDGHLWEGHDHGAGSVGRAHRPNCGDVTRLYDLVGEHALASHAARSNRSTRDIEAEWLVAAAKALAPPIQVLCDSLDLPLVVLDGTLPPDLTDRVIQEIAGILPSIMWGSVPLIRRGYAGRHAPAKGAALRPVYMEFFAGETR